jgi:hypothetical protein
MKNLLILLIVLSAIGVVGLTGCAKQDRPVAQAGAKKILYTCPMHHQIRKEQPGECPICGMTLVPLEDIEETPSAASPGLTSNKPLEKKVKYWMDPMNPNRRSDKPKKAEDGMDYVPVYEEAAVEEGGKPAGIDGLVPIHISPYKEQLINVKYATVEIVPVTRLIRTSGRFAGGEGDFAALAGDFAAQKPLRSSGRYVVADVYALDIPFVKAGQMAYVSSLSGSGPRIPGRVTLVYPYDGTQSRVTRVRINLAQAAPPEIFANVDIEAVTEPRLSVPPAAIMDTGLQKYVFTATAPGTFTPKAVTLGFQGDDLDEVTSGLKAGEKVVVGASFLIDADSKIKAAFSGNK